MNKANWLKIFCILVCIVLLFSTGVSLGVSISGPIKWHVDSAVAKEYLRVLQENKNTICFPGSSSHIGGSSLHGERAVAVVDICGDEKPELLYMTVNIVVFEGITIETGADFHVLCYDNGKAKEILIIESAVYEIGGGGDIIAFFGKDDVFYTRFSEYDGTYYNRYVLENGYLKSIPVLTQYGSEDEDDAVYYDNNQRVISRNEFLKKEAELVGNTSQLCMSSHYYDYDNSISNGGWPFNTPKMLTVSTMVYEEAVDYLKSYVNANQTIYGNPTASTVLVNGKKVTFDAYNIGGNNFFKLRDLAYVLSGTTKQFEVTWDSGKNAINLLRGKAYTIIGGEMEGKGKGEQKATPTTSTIYLDGKTVQLEAYNIGGNNYFKLRDIGVAFDFGVSWDGANNTIIIDTSKGYASN